MLHTFDYQIANVVNTANYRNDVILLFEHRVITMEMLHNLHHC